MSVDYVLSLLGGLALFLYGMHMMSVGLSEACGDKMREILEKLTSKWYLGIMVGAGITALIQSSSATTVMVVGFVNSGLMTLRQAIWIIMGANIGTTITGLLIALNMGDIAPILAILGVIMVVFINNHRINSIGEVFAGFGILFIGLNAMSTAMLPLRNDPVFINFMTSISNPLIAILFGAGFTALIQSSSASVGILQSLAKSGLVPLSTSIYIIFGQNIGTCITSILASLGANRNAKRATFLHLSFNIIGTVLFLIGVQIIPLVQIIEHITSNPMAQIAYTHICFNIITTILLIPFGNQLATLSEKVLPLLPNELGKEENQLTLSFVDTENIGNVPLAILSLRKEAIKMLELAKDNINESLEALTINSIQYSENVEKREDHINYINYQITEYMSKVSILNMSERESDICNSLYKCFTDIERIGDHAYNIIQHSQTNHECIKKASFIQEEIQKCQKYLNQSFDIIMSSDFNEYSQKQIEMIEDKIDELTTNYRKNQIQRCSEGSVDALDTVYYSQIMTDIERVSDHMLNISEELNKNHFSLKDE
ncbi:MAG: Na/Pi cotransporter family protein [Traorella sp.]